MGNILSILCKSLRPQRIYFNQAERAKAAEILRLKCKITKIYGVIIKQEEKTDEYTAEESPFKLCMLVLPRNPKIIKKKDYNISLRGYPEFVGKISTASPAKLAFIAIRGYVDIHLELEHRDHHHDCINPWHHNFVTKGFNQNHKACQRFAWKLKIREDSGRFSKEERTYVPAEEAEPPCTCEEPCIYNRRKSTATDWNHPEKRPHFKKFIDASLPGVELYPWVEAETRDIVLQADSNLE